jgi:DNA-directed RNA polymerase specialized sigma24 family protein
MRPREADGTMIIESGLRGGRPDPGADAITSERRQLINLAYRLLGSLTEAEDTVQEAYAHHNNGG